MPIIDESDASLPLPHFNEEATVLSARPVVPLASSATGFSVFRATTGATLVQRYLPLGLILAAAIGIGIAGGLALSRRHSNQTEAKSSVVPNDPVASTTTTTAATATQSNLPASTIAGTSSQQPVQYTTTTVREKSAKAETQTIVAKSSNDAPTATTPIAPALATARDKHKQTNIEPASQQQTSLPPVATRNRRAQEVSASDENDARGDDDVRAQRRAAREERRRARTDQTDAATPPRQTDRATQQLNRINEIFEGQKP